MDYDKVKIYFTDSDADAIEFPVDDGIQTASYVVKDIQGADPPAIDVTIANQIFEGGNFQGSRPQNRELVILVGFQPKYNLGESMGSLRTKLNGLLTPKLRESINIYFMSEDETQWVYTTGYIKNVAASPFSKDPESQITIATDSAFLSHGLATLNTTGMSKNPITDTNQGDAPCGFGIQIQFTANVSSFKLSNANLTKSMTITYSFLTNDKLWISTIAGTRYLTVERGATSINMLRYKVAGSSWLQLHGGVNELIPNTTAFNFQQFWFTPRRWGV